MINGWYCRSMATDQVDQDYSNLAIKSETSEDETGAVHNETKTREPMIYRMRYRNLKKKLKFLIYENEFLSDTLRSSQTNLLKISQDRTFLLNRLLRYEKPDVSTSESNDETDSSEEDVQVTKKKKVDGMNVSQNSSGYRQAAPVKRKKMMQKKGVPQPLSLVGAQIRTISADSHAAANSSGATTSQKIMTTEEVERHLQSRQSLIELLPEPTVPTEMFEIQD